MLPDDELIKKSLAGDIDAFEEIVRRYQNKVYNIAYRMTGNREDAADLAQEAFIKAYRALPKFRGEASFQTWLYHIITNVCRDELRKKARMSAVSLDKEILTPDGVIFNEVPDASLGPEGILENKEIGENIQMAVNFLGPEYRMTLIMREIQGFSYEEIATNLSCSIGTVKSRLNRARTLVKNILLGTMEPPSNKLRQKQVKGGA